MPKLNWFLQIRNLSKTDPQAAELFEQLQKAETDDQKELAKQNAQNYIQEIQSQQTSDPTPTNDVAPETVSQDIKHSDETDVEVVDNGSTENGQESPEDTGKSTQTSEKDTSLMDLSAPAFNPRLAKCGITREEELFLHGVFVRKMNRDDKILMRRSIYQKKTELANRIQAEYKAKRIAQKEKDANDPEKQRYHQQRKYVNAIVDALSNNCNLTWLFNNIEGLTVDVFRELIQHPGNRNAFTQANPAILDNFKKKFGE